jgi:peroxiredoxin
VRRIYEKLRELGAEVLVISFAPPQRVRTYVTEYPQPFPVVSDPSLAAYSAFALERAPMRSMLRPGVIGRYLLHIFHGWWPKRSAAGEDVRQLGGDFLLDADGKLRYVHPSAEPTDRPSAAELLEQVRKLVNAG